MALDITVGQTVTRTVSALDSAGAADPSATMTLSEDSAGAVLGLSGEATVSPGVVSVVYTGVAAGAATVTGTATDPDGNVVSGTDAVTVSAAVASTDATSVVFS